LAPREAPQPLFTIYEPRNLLKADGLIAAEIDTLHKLYPRVMELCHQLSEYRIPETIEHGDFHHNNILVHEGHFIISDWGDACISHPFFSLASCLNSAIRNHGLTEGDERYLKAQNVYLEKWLAYGSRSQLREAIILAKKLRHFQFALSFSRVKECQGIERFPQFKGYIAESLRNFIKNT
jgi:thiamine kinase-like enzyme